MPFSLTPLQTLRGYNITHLTGNVDNYILYLSSYQASRGANVSIYSLETEKDFSTLWSTQIPLSLQCLEGEKMVSLSKVILTGNEVKNLNIYLIQDANIFSKESFQKRIITPYAVFPSAVITYLRSLQSDLSVIHFHGWETGLGPVIIKLQRGIDDNANGHMKTLFTPHEIKNEGQLGLFSHDQWKLTGLPGELFTHQQLEYFNQISLLKSGMLADMTAFINDEERVSFLKSDIKGISGFAKVLQEKNKLIGLVKGENVHHDNGIFSESLGRNLTESIRAMRNFYSFNLHMSVLPDLENNIYTIDGVFRNTTAIQPIRPMLIKESMMNSPNIVVQKIKTKDVLGQGPLVGKPRPCTGSSIIGLLTDFNSKIRDDGRNILTLDGGEGSRNWGITLAEGGYVKGQIKVLGRRLAEQCASQTFSLLLQLPNKGLGWTVTTSIDNIYVTDRIMMGDNSSKRPLYESKYGLILFGQPTVVAGKDPYSEDMQGLKRFGIGIVNPETGQLEEFLEKTDPGIIMSKVQAKNGEVCYKNTFFMAIRDDVRKLFVKLYNVHTKSKDPSKKGKTLIELGVDWSRHIIEPSCLSKKEWMTGARKYGANKEDKNVAIEDWEILWENAQKIKAASGGIGMANIGENSFWLDTGVNEDLYRKLYYQITLTDGKNMMLNKNLREFFGIKTDIDVIDSYVEGVALPQKKNTYLCMDSVFKKGGKIGPNCVIIGSMFEEYIEIPAGTMIIGSRIFKLPKQFNPNAMGCMIYNYDNSEKNDQPLELEKDMVYVSLYREDGSKINAKHDMQISPDVKDASSKVISTFRDEKVFGGMSFDGVIKDLSLQKTLDAQTKLENDILDFLRHMTKEPKKKK